MSIENGKLPLKMAEQYTMNWAKLPVVPTNQLRAFTIRRTELEFLLLQMTISESNATRIYLGNKSDSPNPEDVIPCLIMVGVNGFIPQFEAPEYLKSNIPGTEKYFTYFPEGIPVSPMPGAHGRSVDLTEGEYVLDFAYPCPHTCDLGSPLMSPPIG